MLRNALTDIVRQTGTFEKIKITGTTSLTKIEAHDKDKILFLKGEMKEPVEELTGEFGIGDLNLLGGLLKNPNYKTDDAKLIVHRTDGNNGEYVSELEFRDKNGAGARFKTMAPRYVGDQAQIANILWDVEVVPTPAKVSEVDNLARDMSSVDKGFGVKVENNTLFITLGGSAAGTHSGSVAFDTNVSVKFAAPRLVFNTAHFLAILKNAGSNKTIVRFSQKGVAGITVETEKGIYNYYLRAKEI